MLSDNLTNVEVTEMLVLCVCVCVRACVRVYVPESGHHRVHFDRLTASQLHGLATRLSDH